MDNNNLLMYIDLVFLFVATFGFYVGFKRGLIKTVFAAFSIFIGILAALKFSPIVINILENAFSLNTSLAFILGLILTFFLVMLLIRFIGKKLEGILKTIKINFINKIIGGAVLSIFSIVCFSVVIWFLNQTKFIPDTVKEESFSYRILEPLPEQSRQVFNSMKPMFKEFWEKTLEVMEKMEN